MTPEQAAKQDLTHYADNRIPYHDTKTRWLGICLMSKEDIDALHAREALAGQLKHPQKILKQAIQKAGKDNFWPKGTNESFKQEELARLDMAFFELERAAQRILQEKYPEPKQGDPAPIPSTSKGWNADAQYWLDLAHLVDNMIVRRAITIKIPSRNAPGDL